MEGGARSRTECKPYLSNILMVTFYASYSLQSKLPKEYVVYGWQICLMTSTMSVMTDKIRLSDELGRQLRAQRVALGMSKSELAEKAGKVREVIYRLEAGQESTVSSLLAVLGALGLVLRLERAGLPCASEVAARFQEDDDAP